MSTLVTSLYAGIDPKVSPNDGFFPFMGTLRNAAGGVLSAVIVLSVIAFLIAVVMLVFGKASKSRSMSEQTTSALVWVVVGAALAGAASGLITWATGLKLF